MRLYPVPGRLVRDPFTREPVPADGRDVPDGDLYWARALADGDVALAPAPPAAPDVALAPATVSPAAPAATSPAAPGAASKGNR